MTNYERQMNIVNATDAEWKRYIKVFKQFMGGDTCRYCGHHYNDHVGLVRQPHFFRPRSAYDTSLEYEDDDGAALTKVVVARAAEMVELYCLECAECKETSQVACWMKTVARGEVIGRKAAG